MDDINVNRYANEIADAITAILVDHSQIEACHTRARLGGYDIRVTLEAVVKCVNRSSGNPVSKIEPCRVVLTKGTFDLSFNDRRFLRSMKIADKDKDEEQPAA